MINISKDSVFNLKPIPLSDVRSEVSALLIDGEKTVAAFKTVRDQLVFTNKRIISVDVQGFTGKRKSYSSLPYSKVQFYSVQTPGFAELVPDAELELMFSNGFTAHFEIRGDCNIIQLGKIISEFVL
ncbi:MAG: PH domain-containing protein [Treponema sp.]|nr:PH domain-containing protein [Treponema sp.]